MHRADPDLHVCSGTHVFTHTHTCTQINKSLVNLVRLKNGLGNSQKNLRKKEKRKELHGQWIYEEIPNTSPQGNAAGTSGCYLLFLVRTARTTAIPRQDGGGNGSYCSRVENKAESFGKDANIIIVCSDNPVPVYNPKAAHESAHQRENCGLVLTAGQWGGHSQP